MMSRPQLGAKVALTWRSCNVLDVAEHGSTFGDIIPIVDIILARCMWYAERGYGAPSFTCIHNVTEERDRRTEETHLVTSLMNAPRKGSEHSSSNVGKRSRPMTLSSSVWILLVISGKHSAATDWL